MCVLIGNTVKTKYADYPCATREEAEALFVSLKRREEQLASRHEASGREEPEPPRVQARKAASKMAKRSKPTPEPKSKPIETEASEVQNE